MNLGHAKCPIRNELGVRCDAINPVKGTAKGDADQHTITCKKCKGTFLATPVANSKEVIIMAKAKKVATKKAADKKAPVVKKEVAAKKAAPKKSAAKKAAVKKAPPVVIAYRTSKAHGKREGTRLHAILSVMYAQKKSVTATDLHAMLTPAGKKANPVRYVARVLKEGARDGFLTSAQAK